MKLPTTTSSRICLSPQQSWQVQARAGTTVHLITGEIELIGAPRWLGGAVVQEVQQMARGEVYVVLVDGWLRLLATDYAELYCRAPYQGTRPLPSRAFELVQRLAHRVRLMARPCQEHRAGGR